MSSDGRVRGRVAGPPFRAAGRAVSRGVGRIWRDLRLRDLYHSGKEFELMHRCMGFAALAILTVVPLLVVIAATNPARDHGIAGWVIYGMGLSRSAAAAVTRLFSAPARVLGTVSAFGALLLAVAGVSFAGSVQAGFEKIWGLPGGPWHKIWRQAIWLLALIAYIYVDATVGAVTPRGPAETALRVALAVVLGVAFFWWGLRFLLGGRVSYLAALPGAVATMGCLAGLRVFSGIVFDPLIATNAVSYGALGTVLIVQSWLIGVGWVLYGGQLFGRWFHDAWLRAWTDNRPGRRKPGGAGREAGSRDAGGEPDREAPLGTRFGPRPPRRPGPGVYQRLPADRLGAPVRGPAPRRGRPARRTGRGGRQPGLLPAGLHRGVHQPGRAFPGGELALPDRLAPGAARPQAPRCWPRAPQATPRRSPPADRP